MAQPISVLGTRCGSIQGQVKLFGWIPCKSINIDICEETKVMPVGRAVGLYIHADGVMVLGTGKVTGKDGVSHTPSYKILQTGDYISEVNGQKVTTIQEISSLVRENGNKSMVLGVNRNSNHIRVKVTPVEAQDGYYQIGVWLREDTEGIGTLTFVTPDNQFAALGHGITDADTDVLIKLQNGGLYPATVNHVETGKDGSPGEISGSVELGRENRLGTIQNNTSLGITGDITATEYQYQESKACAVGRKQEVEKGKATILCQLGDSVKEYEVEIEEINVSSQDNKGMEIRITDPELLQKAGGIVQGMFTSYNRYNTRKSP
jgi:stage IV sporulation protein B